VLAAMADVVTRLALVTQRVHSISLTGEPVRNRHARLCTQVNRQQHAVTGCLEGTHHVTETVLDVGTNARVDHLGRTVPTEHGYRLGPILPLHCLLAMSSGDDIKRKAYIRRAVVGLAVVASTVAANLAAFVEHVNPSRFVMFGVAGVLAAVVTPVPPITQKKMSPELRSGRWS
jgi:hypothetical protein